jgi:hypothetical protein
VTVKSTVVDCPGDPIVYGFPAGAVQADGTPVTITVPLPTATVRLYWPCALLVVVTAPAETVTPARPPPRLLETVPVTVPVVLDVAQVTVKSTVVLWPAAPIVYGFPAGGVQPAGTPLTATVPLPTGTASVYWPSALVALLLPPADTVTPARGPPELRLIVPVTVPVSTEPWQLTLKSTVTDWPLETML